MTPQNPTLLIGLGAFGRAVCARVAEAPEPSPPVPFDDVLPAVSSADGTRESRSPGEDRAGRAISGRPIEVIEPGDDALAGETAALIRAIADDAHERCRRLLDLGYFIDTTRPTDTRGPRLDVFVIGDLTEIPVALATPGLVATLARELRAAFRPILRAGEGALAVCPMLLAPRRTDPDEVARMGQVISELAALARQPDVTGRPQARIYVVEDQSGKYLLSRTELERSFAAFLHLLLSSALRDDRGIRDLIETAGDDRAGPIGTFACATLEIDMAVLKALCELKLAREMLDYFDVGALSLAEIAGEAHPLVPDRTVVEAELWQESPDTSLERYLEPPDIAVPYISLTDSPENITEYKFGPMWQAEARHAIDAFCDEVERFKMDRLAQQIERNGTELGRRVERELVSRIREEALASPRGPQRALEFTRYAATRARSLMDEVKARLNSPNLRQFPPPPIDDRVAEIGRAAHAWPRRDPFRLLMLGVLAVVLGGFALAGLVHVVLDVVKLDAPWWVSGIAGMALATSTIYYSLWRHLKRHHNWLSEARNELDQALQRYLHKDVVDYFRRRLHYTRRLWIFRIYRGLAERLEEAIVQLEGGRAALAEAKRRLDAQIYDLTETREGTGNAGILYRRILKPDTIDAFYRHVKPPEMSAVASRYHEHVTAANASRSPETLETRDPDDVLEAPYADPDRAVAFTRREFTHLSELSPYEAAETPLYAAVETSVQVYLEQLALKLSPPLEIIGTAAGNAPSPSRILVTPPEARGLIERLLSDENLDRGWDVRSISGDLRRIHLLLERGQLPPQAVVAAQPAAAAREPS